MAEGWCFSDAVEHTGVYRSEGADPSRILKQLRELWSGVEEGGERAQVEGPVTRACVLNLVVVLRRGADQNQACEVMSRLVYSYPSRFIVLVEDESLKAGEASSETSAFCTLAQSRGKKVCCEQIVVRAAPDLLEALHQTVAALFVPDLRRYLWWEHDVLTESPLYRRLAMEVDRTIVDTQVFASAEAGLKSVREAIRESSHATLSDLNWARLTPWREITAQLFDSPERRALLGQLREVEIATSTPEGEKTPAVAWLYLGWLASRLGWKADAASHTCRNRQGEPVEVHLRRMQRPGFDRRLVQVLMRTADPVRAEMSLTQSEEMNSVTTFCTAADKPPSADCMALGQTPMHELLAQELSYTERDVGYEQALELAVELLEGIRP